MSFTYNADEIFEMALQIERNGVQFYCRAAEKTDDPDHRVLLADLADMERCHEAVFAEMKEEFSKKEKEPAAFDPAGEAVLYLQALANMRVFFEKKIDPTSMEEILKSAIDAEKDSIIFYLGMRDLVPEKNGKDRIEAIIGEEKKHIQLLSKELVSLKKK